MIVIVQDMYDGFSIVVDGKSHTFDQEDTREGLVEVLKIINPTIDVSYEEVY